MTHATPPHSITFEPPLYLQRHAFLLAQLRQARVSSVLDIGCAEGRLLAHLSHAALQLDAFPLQRFSRIDQACAGAESELRLEPEELAFAAPQIVLQRLSGLDVDRPSLQAAERVLNAAHYAEQDRWLSLDVKLFHGSLTAYDSRLADHECIVASELLEHLDEETLQHFAPVVLGRYAPKLLIVTTPNFDFNRHFEAHGKAHGFEDPTGRTTRRFRHDDHQFEWTQEEFATYCSTIAAKYGYDVELSGLGELWQGGNADADSRFCTSTAVFRRQVRGASARRRRERERMERFGGSLARPPPSASGDESDGPTGFAGEETEEEESDVELEDTSRRSPRSRQPSHLPWLSSPQPARSTSQTFVSSPSPPTSAAHKSISAPAALPASPTESEDQPHALVFQRTLPAFAHDADDSAERCSTPALAPDEIASRVLDELSLVGQSSSLPDGTPSAHAPLSQLWLAPAVRAACGGRIVALLDALRLVEPTSEEKAEVDEKHVCLLGGDASGEWRLCALQLRDACQEEDAQTVAGKWHVHLSFSGAEVRNWLAEPSGLPALDVQAVSKAPVDQLDFATLGFEDTHDVPIPTSWD